MICLRLSRVHNATSKIVTHEELQGPAYNFVRISGKRGVSAYYSMFGNYVEYGIYIFYVMTFDPTFRDLARNEEFSEIAVIHIFLQFSKQKHSYLLGGGGSCGENFEISHAIDK